MVSWGWDSLVVEEAEGVGDLLHTKTFTFLPCRESVQRQRTRTRLLRNDVRVIVSLLSRFRQLIFFDLIDSDFLRFEVEPLYFYPIVFDVLEYFHHFSINLTANSLTLLKQFPHNE
jgi:hypothetical protein